VLLREDGAYGPIGVTIPNPAGGPDVEVESIIDLNDTNLKIYEAHYAMTKEWADTLLSKGYPSSLALSYDRTTGNVDYTLGQLAAQPAGTYHETFHFALNNFVASDNRIPPYGMRYDVAKQRNALPVPANQYGGGTPGSIYNYWDAIDLNTLKPSGAVYATIDLLYQGTSWEYIQFLWKGNNGTNAFLGEEGVNMLDAWINAEVPVAMNVGGDRKMVPPVVMASTTWGTPPTVNNAPVANNDNYSTPQDTTLNVVAPGVLGNDTDADGDPLTAAQLSSAGNGSATLNANGSFSYTPNAGFTGNDSFSYEAHDNNGGISAPATVTITVTGQVVCGDYTNKNVCNAQATCSWNNRTRTCLPK